MNLPNELNYNENLVSLPPDTTRTQIVLTPITGSGSYTSSQIVSFDFPSTGFMVPSSLSFRYKATVTGNSNLNGGCYHLLGTPIYTPILRSEIVVGSTTAESLNQYNQIENLLTNLRYSTADKFGAQTSLGFSNGENKQANVQPTTIAGITNNYATSSEYLDGRSFYSRIPSSGAAADTAYTDIYTVSAPIHNILSYSKKLIPLGLTGSIRLSFTIDSINAMFSTGLDKVLTGVGNGPLAFNIPNTFEMSNLELVYDMMNFNNEVLNIVNENEKIYIKSQSFSNSAQILPGNLTGSTTLSYNVRLASIKCAFLNMSPNDAIAVNKSYDSVDISKSQGLDAQLTISGINYPQKAYSTRNNKAGIYTALKECIGTIYDVKNSFSISNLEFNATDQGGYTPSIAAPGKFYVGFNLEKMRGNSLLTGISSQQSAINLLLNFPVATSFPTTCNLIINHDALIEIDVLNRQVSIKQ
jgi:hypothetical protein